MRACVITESGGPDKLELREVDRPSPLRDWVLIRNRAFGRNGSAIRWFLCRIRSRTKGECISIANKFGMAGPWWTLEEFHPIGDVPTGVKLTSYSGEASDISTEQLQRYISLVESEELALKVGPKFEFDQLQEAHEMMDRNQANGKSLLKLSSRDQ